MNNLGTVALSPVIDASGEQALYSYSKGNIFRIFFPGDVGPEADGGSFNYPKEFFIRDSGDVIFHSTLCCGSYKEGIFLASFPRAAIPNGSFETPGQSGLPANWQTAWSSSGSSEAWQYTYAGDAPDGSSVLRLHVRPGGGSTFVLSDPILVVPAAAYMITARMRYYLNSNSDTVFFSVIQLDARATWSDLMKSRGSGATTRGIGCQRKC